MITKRVTVLALAVITSSTVQAQTALSPAPAKVWGSMTPMVHVGHNSNWDVGGAALGLGASTQRWEFRVSLARYHNFQQANCQDDCPAGIRSSAELAVLARPLNRTDRTGWYLGPTFGWISSPGASSAVGITLGYDGPLGRLKVLRLEAHGLQALNGWDTQSWVGFPIHYPAIRQVVVSAGVVFLAPL